MSVRVSFIPVFSNFRFYSTMKKVKFVNVLRLEIAVAAATIFKWRLSLFSYERSEMVLILLFISLSFEQTRFFPTVFVLA